MPDLDTRAWVQRDPGGAPQLESLVLAEPLAHEIVVRMVATGVCHTDLIAPAFAKLPAVFGHEGSGIVEWVGPSVTKVKAGDRVALSFGSCGNCRNCHRGSAFMCASSSELNFQGQRGDGSVTLSGAGGAVRGAFFQQSSFATRVLATERNAVKVPDDFPLDLAGPLGCGIQTGAGAVINTLGVSAGSSIAVFGAGSVGLSAIMAARLTGCIVIIAVDVRDDRLAMAMELGATHGINATAGNVVEQIRQVTGDGVQYSIETAAQVQTFKDAINCLERGGVCGLVAVPGYGKPFEFSPATLLSGRAIKGVLLGSSVPDVFIPQLMQLQRAGKLPYERFVTFYDFDDLPRALADAAEGRAVKPILRHAGWQASVSGRAG